LITAGGESGAVAEVELPGRAEIEIDDAVDLMFLLGNRIELREGACRPIIFNGEIDFLCHVVANVHVRRKDEWRRRCWSAQRFLERWIERHVPAAELLVVDRAKLVGPRVAGELGARVAAFLREAHADRPAPRLGGADR